MRFSGLLTLVSLVLLPLSSCTNLDPAPVYLRMDYQMRCLDCQNAADYDPRRIKALDGEKNLAIDCFVSEEGGERVLSFSALYRDPQSSSKSYEIKVSQARLDKKDPGDSCKVSVEEGGTTYGGKNGKCTADAPSDETPCQVELQVDGDIIDGTVYCKKLTAAGNIGVWRHLVEPFTESDPAVFELRNCVGL